MKNRLMILLCMLTSIAIVGCGNTNSAESISGNASCNTSENAVVSESDFADGTFTYIHDPRLNPRAMEDIVENPDAIYGFSPSPDSARLGSFASEDWTDPEKVAGWREERIAYHESFNEMYDLLREMREQGCSIEEMARAVSGLRNQLRLDSYKDDPEGLERCKASNLEKYGNEEGPTADSLYEKYGSWELVIQNSFSTNPGMDACLGLYDDQYPLYIELGIVPEE